MANIPAAGPQLGAAACYRATVQARDATNTYWVTVDGFTGNKAAQMVESWVWPLVTTGAASTGTAHTHGPGHVVALNDRVLVMPVAGNIDDLLIIARLTA